MTSGLAIHEVSQGNRQALTEVYRQYFPAIWRYVAAHLPANRQAVEDVVSETWLAAVRGIGKFDPARGSVHGWLLGIARNKVNDYWIACGKLPDSDPSAEPADHGPGPDQELITAEDRAGLLRILDRLEDSERLALEWKYLEGLSVREIARRLDMKTPKAAEDLLYRARNALRAHYQARRAEND